MGGPRCQGRGRPLISGLCPERPDGFLSGIPRTVVRTGADAVCPLISGTLSVTSRTVVRLEDGHVVAFKFKIFDGRRSGAGSTKSPVPSGYRFCKFGIVTMPEPTEMAAFDEDAMRGTGHNRQRLPRHVPRERSWR